MERLSIEDALFRIRNWRNKPEAVERLLQEYERLQRQVQQLMRPSE